MFYRKSKSEGRYSHKKAEFQGIKFDSKMEMDYYIYLLAEKTAGHVVRIELQPKFKLFDGFKRHNKVFRPMTYTPDFLVEYSDGFVEAIDVKGAETQQSEMRAKLFCMKYYTPLRWVRWKNKSVGWTDVKVWYDPDNLELPF